MCIRDSARTVYTRPEDALRFASERGCDALAVGMAPDLFPTWGEATKIRQFAEEEAVYDIAAIINAEPERYPILYEIINTDILICHHTSD